MNDIDALLLGLDGNPARSSRPRKLPAPSGCSRRSPSAPVKRGPACRGPGILPFAGGRQARFALAAAGTAAAAAAAAVLAITLVPQPPPGSPASRASARAGRIGLPGPRGPFLADGGGRLSWRATPLPGNASLEILTHTLRGKVEPGGVWALYTDGGVLYEGDDNLMAAIAQEQNGADAYDSHVKAAAITAVTGNLATARMQMIQASAGTYPEQYNNVLWTNAVNALSWAGASWKIRVGVLRLLSTIPGVTVADSKTGGRPRWPSPRDRRCSAVREPGAHHRCRDRAAGQHGNEDSGGRGLLPDLPGDGGQYQGRQVLTAPGTRDPGLSQS